MTRPTHPCCARGCRVLVLADKLMCPPHWKLVPLPLRRNVWRTYRAWLEPDAAFNVSIGVKSYNTYIAAAREAIAAVADIECNPPRKQVRS